MDADEKEIEYFSDSEREEAYQILNPTHQLFLDLRENFYSRVKPSTRQNGYRGMALPSPIIIEAQLLEATNDKLSLRNEIEVLIRNYVIRCFVLSLNHYRSERYFMLEIDYIDMLEQMNDKTVNRFISFLKEKKYIAPTISPKTLEENGFNQNDIDYFINKKVLLLNTGRGQKYIMSIPGTGNVIASISYGRQELVNYLNHQRNKITDLANVERQNIRNSIFYAEFHCKELIGLDIFEVIKIPNRPAQVVLKFNPYQEKK